MSSPAADPERSLPRVLVVDDSLVERSLFLHMVTKWGYPIDVASSGAEALEKIQKENIQLVLADWQMPGMEGTDLCAQVRKLDSEHYTYIILMSAQSDEEFLIKALDAGADDVLSKPIDGNELEARLQSAVRRIELQAQLQQRTVELGRAHDVIAHDLSTVSGLQRSYLPAEESPFPDFHYQWLSVPSMYVSGDHLNAFKLQDQVYGFYLLDVSGHGIPAAVKSMQLVQMFADQSDTSLLFDMATDEQGLRRVSKPSQVVSRLNMLFQQTETDLSYFTMIYGVVNAATRTVSLCQAGHPSPFLQRADGSVQTLGSGGYPVGLFDEVEYDDIELVLAPNDALLLYSDGVTEVLSPALETFGENRLLGSVSRHKAFEQRRYLLEDIQGDIQAWGGKSVQVHGFQDDVSILMLSLESWLSEDEPKQEFLLAASVDPVFRLQDKPKKSSDDQSERKKSIVIVDDSRSFLRIFEAMLNSWGYKVHSARNGSEALRLIETVQPDFVLTDWDMPGMSGIELCEHVRSQKQNAYIYIIMVTGYASRDDLLNSLRVGADDFLTKPVNPSELKVRLKTAERIANLHINLEQRHEELKQLYEALQRDMREVSRIQRALLPKTKSEPWPCAIQTLYQPSEYVCGKQVGLLETRPNEYGFFMINMPGDDTSTALQAMALARWFSISRATQVLFPIDATTTKQQRFLAPPSEVRREISRVSPSFRANKQAFDLLYGLLNLDQGTLLLAGIGDWTVAIASPGQPAFFHTAPLPEGGVVYQDTISPGTRMFLYPSECGRGLGLDDPHSWQTEVLVSRRGGNASGSLLENEFARILRIKPQLNLHRDDLMLVGIQWRENFPPHAWKADEYQLSAWQQKIRLCAQATADTFETHTEALNLGEFRDAMSYSMVCDTQNIGVFSNTLRDFLEKLGLDEAHSYNVDLAVSECLTNVMIHGFRAVHPKPATIAILAFEHGVGAMVCDQGNPVPKAVLDRMRVNTSFDPDLNLIDLPEGGMGLKFMRMVSRRFLYESDSGMNTLWMVF